MCLKESCFPDWQVSLGMPVFKNVGKRSTAKRSTAKRSTGLFSDIKYGFRSSRSTGDLLTVVSDRIARAFNRCGATQAVAT